MSKAKGLKDTPVTCELTERTDINTTQNTVRWVQWLRILVPSWNSSEFKTHWPCVHWCPRASGHTQMDAIHNAIVQDQHQILHPTSQKLRNDMKMPSYRSQNIQNIPKWSESSPPDPGPQGPHWKDHMQLRFGRQALAPEKNNGHGPRVANKRSIFFS